MPFENENTFLKYRSTGREEEFHTRYEKALQECEKYFGREYPNIVVQDVTEEKKIIDISPINGKEILKMQNASVATLNRALDILKGSYRKWYDLGYLARSRIFLKAADIMSERKFEFSAMLAWENGKNRFEAMGDVDEAIDFLRYYAINLIENQGFVRFTGKAYSNEESISVMKPYGVFAVIAPFNFFSITVGMTAGPLLVGNSVILKPSSDIPLSSYLFVRLLHEAGVPKENLAFLSGSGSQIGDPIVTDKRINGILFTGSRSTGIRIFQNANRDSPKVVITEMGGKDAIIVSDKANLQKAIEGVYRSAFGYSGQKCSACSIVYAQSGIYDSFVKGLVERTKKEEPKDPRKRDAFSTPVVNKEAFLKFKEISSKLPAEGKVLTGARTLDNEGYYCYPTVVADLKENSFVLKDELFLPVLAVRKVESVKDAVDEINRSDYGLTGGIFTEDQGEIDYYFSHADVGVIYANRSVGGSTGAMVGSQPFVGWKMSGVSGKGTGSFYYLQQFLREQSQTVVH